MAIGRIWTSSLVLVFVSLIGSVPFHQEQDITQLTDDGFEPLLSRAKRDEAFLKEEVPRCAAGYVAAFADCNRNYYKPIVGKFKCQRCENGTGTVDGDFTQCIPMCPPGHRLESRDDNSRTCVECEPGTYMSEENLEYNCTDCPEWTTSEAKASSCHLACPAGYGSNDDISGCIECPEGTYSDSIGDEKCMACPTNYTTIGTKSNKCIEICRPGTYYDVTTGNCFNCPPGTFKASSSIHDTCSNCPANRSSDEGASFCYLMCPEGEEEQRNTSSCIKCPESTYKSTVGPGPCTDCPLNKTTLTDGTIKPKECVKHCEAGKWYNFENKRCMLCKAKSYKSIKSSRVGCTECPLNSNSEVGATSCFPECTPGYELNIKGDKCKKCNWGFVKTQNGNHDCEPCPNDKFTMIRGASKKLTDCKKIKATCVFDAATSLITFEQYLEGYPFGVEENFVTVVKGTCTSATIRPVIEDIVNKFQTCVELSELEFTDVIISNHVFGPQDLKRVFAELSAYNGHYCDYFDCVEHISVEINKCTSAVDTSTTVSYCSNQWRAVASCILTNLLSCRAIQFLPDIFPYELNGRTVYDLIDISNVVTFCESSCNIDTCINGVCTEGSGSLYCRCWYGFKGQRCDEIDEIEPEDPITVDPCQTNGCGQDCAYDVAPPGFTNLKNTRYGEDATAECDASSGYAGTAIAGICQANGIWDAASFSGCFFVDCADDVTPFGFTNLKNTRYGEDATADCDASSGYAGTAIAGICQANGTWDAASFSGCHLVDCADDVTPFGFTNLKNTRYGEDATADCDASSGYAGTAIAGICQANGIWDAASFSGCHLVGKNLLLILEFLFQTYRKYRCGC